MVATTIQHLISPATLPCLPSIPSLSVLSYNVLLPNSSDGWWNYKMYNPPQHPSTQQHISTWDHRRTLLKNRLQTINSDVVCLQEVSPDSFLDDFSFMKELGYDECELFRKGRFRPATFWKTKRCRLIEAIHRDRTLLTTFRLLDDDDDTDDDGYNNWHVLNCHLQAGKQAKRRLRQIVDGVGTAVKLARRLGEKNPQSPLLVICGDFNGDDECAAIRLLEDGSVTPDFMEDGESVTSKTKTIPTSSPLVDVPASLERDPPATLVVSELISMMVDPSTLTYGNPRLSQTILNRLENIYKTFATHYYDEETTTTSTTDDGSKQQQQQQQAVMNCHDVERWLISINGKVGRGSEFRAAAKAMGWCPPLPSRTNDNDDDDSPPPPPPRVELPPDGILTMPDFCNIYEAELQAGKFWGIAHDLAVLGEALPDGGLYEGRFDRLYCSQALRPVAVLDTICDKPCPNECEPSDHLPVGATFCLS